MKLVRYIRLDPDAYEESEEYALAQLGERLRSDEVYATLDEAVEDVTYGADCPVMAVTIELETALLHGLKTILNESLFEEALAALEFEE